MIVHVSNTQISSDARILKEISSLAERDITLVGVSLSGEQHCVDVNEQFDHYELTVFRFKWVILSHIVNFFYFNMVSFFLYFKIRPLAIHCHDTYPLLGAMLYKFFRFGNPKVIYDCHELESSKSTESSALSKVTYSIEWCLVPFVDGFITVSDSILCWYRDKLRLRSPSVIIFNSVNLDPLLTFKDPDLSSPRFVYVGLFEEGRNIKEIIDLINANEDWKIDFVGWGSLTDYIHAQSKINCNIRCLAPLPHAELLELLKFGRYDYGFCLIEDVSLSDRYCLPNKLFEYSFNGIRCICSALPELEKFSEETNSGICISDIDEISNIGKMVGTEVSLANLKEYSWQTMEKRLNNLYRQLGV